MLANAVMMWTDSLIYCNAPETKPSLYKPSTRVHMVDWQYKERSPCWWEIPTSIVRFTWLWFYFIVCSFLKSVAISFILQSVLLNWFEQDGYPQTGLRKERKAFSTFQWNREFGNGFDWAIRIHERLLWGFTSLDTSSLSLETLQLIWLIRLHWNGSITTLQPGYRQQSTLRCNHSNFYMSFVLFFI